VLVPFPSPFTPSHRRSPSFLCPLLALLENPLNSLLISSSGLITPSRIACTGEARWRGGQEKAESYRGSSSRFSENFHFSRRRTAVTRRFFRDVGNRFYDYCCSPSGLPFSAAFLFCAVHSSVLTSPTTSLSPFSLFSLRNPRPLFSFFLSLLYPFLVNSAPTSSKKYKL